MRGRSIARIVLVVLFVFLADDASGVGAYTKGREYYKKGLYELARTEFEKDLRENPKNAYSHFFLAMVLFSQNRLEFAVEHFGKAVEIDYYIPNGHYALGICLKKKGEFDQAQKAFQRAVKTEPSSAKNYFNWGVCLARLKRYEEAMYAFRQSLSRDRSNAYSYYNLADLFRLTGNHHEAILYFDVVIRRKPNFAPARVGKALALETLGRNQEALVEFLKATELAPGDPKAYGFVGATYAKLGQQEKAKKYFELYEQRKSSTPSPPPSRESSFDRESTTFDN